MGEAEQRLQRSREAAVVGLEVCDGGNAQMLPEQAHGGFHLCAQSSHVGIHERRWSASGSCNSQALATLRLEAPGCFECRLILPTLAAQKRVIGTDELYRVANDRDGESGRAFRKNILQG